MAEPKYKVVEIFRSISGESIHSGSVAVFVRLYGCNLRCHYSEDGNCDTPYGYEGNDYTEMTAAEIIRKIYELSPNGLVILTGGEPLIHDNIEFLLGDISEEQGIRLEVETNGSVDVRQILQRMENAGYTPDPETLSFTIDYKCPSSKMTSHMIEVPEYVEMFNDLVNDDYEVAIKFVVADKDDLICASLIADRLMGDVESEDPRLDLGDYIFLSPVFGTDVSAIVECMTESNVLCWCKLQLQLHKYIWDPDKRGV